jgi:osmotically-inducible protein OsmY
MKITSALTITSALLLAAGCAHEERQADYGTTDGQTSYNSSSTYYGGEGGTVQTENDRNRSAGSAEANVGVSGGYSAGANGMYSSGGAGDSDNTIVTQVRQSLEQDPEIAPIVPNLQITANNGTVVISGSVQSDEQKRQIESLVHKSAGVVTVNNKLTISANSGSSNRGNSQLNPTGSSSGNSQRLYKDANSADNSTNNALNPTSNSGENPIYQQGNQVPSSLNSSNSNSSSGSQLNPTSRKNSSSQMYQGSEQKNGQEQNAGTNSSSNEMSPTSRPNGSSQLYQGGQEKSSQEQNGDTSTNSNSLNPTSRANGQSQIYQQGDQGQKGQEQNTNRNNQTP